MRNLIIFSVAFLTFSQLGQAADERWIDTYEAGLEKAAGEEKDVLIAFMGSDWCPQCETLKEAVLSKDEFLETVKKNFVLVELDYPQTKPEIAERNEPIRVQYGVKGYPVLILADSKGDPFGEVRYQLHWKTTDYLREIQNQTANKMVREEARVEIEKADNDRARTAALEKFLRAVPETSISKMYSEEFDALRKSSRDQSSLVEDIVKKERLENMQNELQTLMGQRRYQEAVTLCEKFLANGDMSSHEQQAGYTFKYYSLMAVRDFEEAVKAAKALYEVDPTSPIGKQAAGLEQRAQAALAKGGKGKPVRPVVPGTKGEPVGEKEDSTPEVAKTDGVAPTQKEMGGKMKDPKEKVPVSDKHQKSLMVLDAAHQALAAAEEALAKAEADLAAARERHAKAHQAELAARKPAEEKPGKSTPEIDAFEERAAKLRKQAEELRKSAEELRKETQE